MAKPLLIVLAGSYQEYRQWRKDLPSEVQAEYEIYQVVNYWGILGVRNALVIELDGYYHRNDQEGKDAIDRTLSVRKGLRRVTIDELVKGVEHG